ncbi:MAG: cbb3-type cytochrome oxidase assembly protein CcoS [Flavobacteriales bacterium CG_4_9_14_3_um_filter_40_17]|nr:MAG: cbb3-type cytochrome oxidase assembly protein CcoS [Flavobacteriales bacterium CG_4_9_14_3_um_filter_40_17]
MSVIYLLISVSLLVAMVFLVLFIISVRNGQYDDTYTPSVRMLFEEEEKTNQEKNN